VRRDRTLRQFAVPADLSSMHIIRFVMPSKSKALVPYPRFSSGIRTFLTRSYRPQKKLLYMYYEICPKHDANGKLKQEMILVWYVKCRRKRFPAQNTNSSRRQQWNTVTCHRARYLEAFEAHTASFDLLHANEFIRGMWVARKVEIYLSHF
jgi:hypothetical protein